MKKKLIILTLISVFLLACNETSTKTFNLIKNQYIGKKYEISSLFLWRKTSDSFFLVTEEENYFNVMNSFSSLEFRKYKRKDKDSMISSYINVYSLIFEYSYKDDLKQIYVNFTEDCTYIDIYDHDNYSFFFTNSTEDYYQATKEYYLEIFHR